MDIAHSAGVVVETHELYSDSLERTVVIDFYLPEGVNTVQTLPLLLINDGQDLRTFHFENLFQQMLEAGQIRPVFCVAIHCGEDRMNEYGMASAVDYKGRGAKAYRYTRFVMTELLPFVHQTFEVDSFPEYAYAGFSMGGLSALDIAWHHPEVFRRVGVFSGSLWWRSRDKDDKEYNQQTDRLMHALIRNESYKSGMKFFFQCGELDESEDRNRNGVIDSIDDTIDLMRELLYKGYREGKDMAYLQLPEGKHDVPTWAKAWPYFLKWGWKA